MLQVTSVMLSKQAETKAEVTTVTCILTFMVAAPPTCRSAYGEYLTTHQDYPTSCKLNLGQLIARLLLLHLSCHKVDADLKHHMPECK